MTNLFQQCLCDAASSGFHDGVASAQLHLIKWSSSLSFSESLLVGSLADDLTMIRYSNPDYRKVYDDATYDFFRRQQIRQMIIEGINPRQLLSTSAISTSIVWATSC